MTTSERKDIEATKAVGYRRRNLNPDILPLSLANLLQLAVVESATPIPANALLDRARLADGAIEYVEIAGAWWRYADNAWQPVPTPWPAVINRTAETLARGFMIIGGLEPPPPRD
jgi:hypothetical protein